MGAAINLTYKEVEELLARLHDVHPERRGALLGRIKHLQRLGWPEGTNVGKGSRVRYDTQKTLSLVIAFELLDVGVTPERTVSLLNSQSVFYQIGLLGALRRYRGQSGDVEFGTVKVTGVDAAITWTQPGDAFVIVAPAALRPLRWHTEAEREALGEAAYTTTNPETISDFLRGSNLRHAALIDLSIVIEDLVGVLAKMTTVDLDELDRDLEAWLQEQSIRMDVSFDGDSEA